MYALKIATLIACAASLGAQEQAAWATRTISIQDLAGFDRRAPVPPAGQLIGGDFDTFRASMLSEGHEEWHIGSEIVEEVTRNSASFDDLEGADELDFRSSGGRFSISGNAATVKEVVDRIAFIAGVVSRPITIEAALYEADAAERIEDVLGAEPASQLAARLPRLWHARTAVRSGQTATLAQQRSRRIIRGHQVEVSINQWVADPVIVPVFEGVHVRVQPHRIPGQDRIVLFGHAVVAELEGPVVARPSGVVQIGSSDVPRVANSQFTFSGLVEADGGALVCSMLGDRATGRSYVLVVSATLGEPGPKSQAPIDLIPISALTTRSLSWRAAPQPPQENQYVGGINLLDGETVEEAERLEADHIHEVATYAIERDGDFHSSMHVAGGYLWVMGPEGERRRVRAVVEVLHRQWLRGATLDVESLSGSRRSDPSSRVFGAGDELGAGDIVHRIRIPALLGRPHAVLRGVESLTVTDLTAQIAEGAAASTAMVANVFDGILVNALVTDGAAGLAVDFDLQTESQSGQERRPSEILNGPDLYLPVSSRGSATHTGLIAPGTFVELGCSGQARLGTESVQLLQRVRVTPR